MPIQSDDIKLLRSSVMADVPEGGGGATGVEIIDGASNNVFPDISTDDGAAGRFRLRQVFGAAHTNDADLLLGASFVVLENYADPLVNLTLFETDGWFDTRTEALSAVEAYYVKGPKLLCRIADVQFAGSLLLRLYNIAPATGFPAASDTVVVRNPNGAEQYVRIVKTTVSQQQVQISAEEMITVNLCDCELAEVLEFDVLGAAISKTPPGTNAASLYSTAQSTGVKFYGTKPLALPAEVGDRSVTVEGGIYAPLVPASTVPTPVIDQYPLVTRPSLSRTAAAVLTLPAVVLALGPGTVLQLPTACEPGTLAMTHGATPFTSNAAGEVLQGTTVVGALDHRSGTMTMSGAAPSYGSASNVLTYKPATITGATAHSQAVEITIANQGLAWTRAFEPPPAPGTLAQDFMAQGRWYRLEEDGSGKLAGADSTYGSGQLNFLTGSLLSTLGALPDVGSAMIFTWGDTNSARAATGLPARAWANIALAKQPQPGTLSISWPIGAGGTNVQTATVSAAGVVTGPAQVGAVTRVDGGGYLLPFSPNTLPTGPVTVDFTAAVEEAGFTNDGGGQYTLSTPPLAGSVRFTVLGVNGATAKAYKARSQGTDVFIGATLIGQINNATGVMTLNGASSVDVTTHVKTKHTATDSIVSMS